MRYITLILISLIFCLAGCKATRPAAEAAVDIEEPAAAPGTATRQFDYYEQSTWLLGFFEPVRMKREPHASWYFKGYDTYMPESDALNQLPNIPKEDLSIKIVMGTWCPDSRREVPRFMRILEAWQFPAEKVTFIGVDVNKVSPIGDYDKLNIERVPTFIIYKNNIEAGRIIEVPKTSLEQDIVNILTGNEK
jgi:thiol-disulfide isomerase/thioredoxin